MKSGDPPSVVAETAEAQRLEDGRLGQTPGVIQLHSLDEQRRATLRLANQAHRLLQVSSADLDPGVFDQPPFAEALTALATTHRGARVQILIEDPRALVTDGHRILEIARRLTSTIELRVLCADCEPLAGVIVLADHVAYLQRPVAERYEGILEWNAPRKTRRLMESFANAWEHSLPDPELRRLYL